MSALVGGTVGEALAGRAAETNTTPASERTSAPSRLARRAAVVFGVGGALLAVGGTMHPHETSGSMHESLLALVGSPAWLPAHAVLLAGMLTALVGLVLLRRHDAFPAGSGRGSPGRSSPGRSRRRSSCRTCSPGSEHDALEAGGRPRWSTRIWPSRPSRPRSSACRLRCSPSRSLGPRRRGRPGSSPSLGVVGGLGFAVAAPLLAVTGNPQVSNLFAAQTLIDVWIIGTSVRVVLARGRPGAEPPRAARGMPSRPAATAYPCAGREAGYARGARGRVPGVWHTGRSEYDTT